MKSIAATTVALAALAAAPAAQAADVRVFAHYGPNDKAFVTYTAVAGEVNSPTFAETDSGLSITDPTATMSSDGSCQVSANGHLATCAAPRGLAGLHADLRDLDDTAVLNVTGEPTQTFFIAANLRVTGGRGDDELTGSDSAADALSGNAGDDVLDGRGGDDILSDALYYGGYPGGEDPGNGGTNVFRGGAGDDSLTGGREADDLQGGDGKDFLRDDDGSATMTGGAGDDVFARDALVSDETPSTAVIDGGADLDRVSYGLYDNTSPDAGDPTIEGATIRLDAVGTTTGNGTRGQNDSLTGIEDASGTFARDVITGSAVANDLIGYGGDDTIDGGAGRDNLVGFTGADNIRAQDGEGDRVRCGEQSGGEAGDVASVDDIDLLDRCPAVGAGTAVNQTGPPPQQPQQGNTQIVRQNVLVPAPTPPADTQRPDISGTKLAKRIKLSTLRSPGYRVEVLSKDAQPNQVVATLTGRLKGRARIASIGDVIIAQRTRTFTGRTAFRLKPPAGKLRRAIRRRTRLRLVVEVRDAAGNRSTRSTRIRVR